MHILSEEELEYYDNFYWTCQVCGAQNSTEDAECQFCEGVIDGEATV